MSARSAAEKMTPGEAAERIYSDYEELCTILSDVYGLTEPELDEYRDIRDYAVSSIMRLEDIDAKEQDPEEKALNELPASGEEIQAKS